MSSQLDVMGRFETFINEFTDEDGILRYREKIREMPPLGSRSLYISFNDLLHHDPRLAEEVLTFPEEYLVEGTKVLIKILQQIDPQYIEKYYQFHIRLKDLTDRVHLRSLRTEHLGLLTSFEGIVIGVTDAKPLLIEGHFKCASCGEANQIVEFPEGIYSPPYQCNNDTCQRKGSLVLQFESSRFIDWQKITIQEKPEELPPGQLPQSVMIHVLDDLVDKARPGDRVEVVGVLKARASRMLKRGQLATYSKFFNGVSVRKETAEYVDIEITDEDLVKIKELSESPYIVEKIRDSLAPSIYGHDLVKEGIATLLFGGTLKETPDGMKIRGESNILLIGDPGVGKSQLLKFVARLAPRALYTTGKGSTAAGLCVSGDSEVWLSNKLTPISDIVEKEFERGDIETYNGTMKFKRIYESKLQTYHSKNLEINLQSIERVWKIKSPENIYSISTRTGKKLKLTSETGLLTICPEIGLVWKAAKLLKKKDRVATARNNPNLEIKEVPSQNKLDSDKFKEPQNPDNIPNVNEILKEIISFYGYSGSDPTEYNGGVTASSFNKEISRQRLGLILSKIKLDWHRYQIRIDKNLRFQFYQELKESSAIENMKALTRLSDTQVRDFFLGEDTDPHISVGIFKKMMDLPTVNLSSSIKEYLDKTVAQIKKQDKILREKFTLLESISKSDIVWDEITEVEFVKAEDEFVYDLTIPNTHNFLVNGFITHNTAAVIRDQDTGEITLEAGALVLADQGIAMIDEFDKMRSDDRTAIHEAMEQHTISIAKAGIVATLNARTSILAAANPKRGRWNPFKATAANLNLPPTILSRFDLIFVLEDKPNLKEDHDKASHILSLHKLKTLPTDPPIQQDLLRKYIAYARREIHPKLSDDAVARLLEYYTELRSSSGKIEEDRPDPIAITPRQLEGLVRLSEARAKMRLSEEVSYEDASGAVHLLNATLDKLARDETGKLDIDKYSSGMSDKSRRRLDRIDDLIDNMLKETEDGEPVAISAVLKQAEEDGLDRNQVEKAIEQRIRVGKLFAPQPGRIKKI